MFPAACGLTPPWRRPTLAQGRARGSVWGDDERGGGGGGVWGGEMEEAGPDEEDVGDEQLMFGERQVKCK